MDFFLVSPGFLGNLVRKSPEDVEKIALSPGGDKTVESCRRLWLSWVFRPRETTKVLVQESELQTKYRELQATSQGVTAGWTPQARRLPFATKTLPTRKNYFRIIFRLPFHDFDFFELILENYPIPIVFV